MLSLLVVAGAAAVVTAPVSDRRVFAGGECDPEVDVSCNDDSLDTPGENEVGAPAIARIRLITSREVYFLTFNKVSL